MKLAVNQAENKLKVITLYYGEKRLLNSALFKFLKFDYFQEIKHYFYY
jgi:hypothetical protein